MLVLFLGETMMRMLAALALIMMLSQRSMGTVVLFDAQLGTAPASQGWTFVADPILNNSVTQTVGSQHTALDTRNPMTDRGGYFVRNPLFPTIAHPLMPTIDRTVGFTIEFDLRIEVENHTTGPSGDDNGDGLDDRAGYALIVISSDTQGIELSFWNNRIWAQEDDFAGPSRLFTQAEGSPLDTTAGIIRYQLQMFGSTYRLIRDSGVASILTGRVRDYGNFMGTIDPYEIANFLFLGDNTTRGESLSQLAGVRAGSLPSMCMETNALVAAIVSGQNLAAFDVTGDGMVNRDDLSAWLREAGEFRLGAGRTFLPGDANFDGNVDGSDFGIWNSHKFTAAPGWCSGDFNADGLVDGSDFGIWNSHKFTSSIASGSVPEPATVSAAIFLAGLLGLFRKRMH
jgi:hypothetical protein